MKYHFAISPGASPAQLPGWYVFNTWLQKLTGETIQFESLESFEQQRQKIHDDALDLIFVNPYDAALLVREKGFQPLAKPQGQSDEVSIVVNHAHSAQSVEDLQPGLTLASVDDPDVHLIGMMLLEPADLNSQNLSVQAKPNYVSVAKALIREEAEVGMFSSEAFEELSSLTKRELRPLVSSQIQVIHHSLLLGPRLAHYRERLTQALLQAGKDAKSQHMLEGIGLSAWASLPDEEIEFMLDLMDALG